MLDVLIFANSKEFSLPALYYTHSMFKSNIYFFYMWIHVVFMVAFAARVSLMTGGSGQLSLAKILPSSCGIHTQVNS